MSNALPVTGSGPITAAFAIIGVALVAVGGFAKRIASVR